MTIMTAIENAIEALDEAVNELPRVSASKIGLDVRAGYVHVDLEGRCIISQGHHGSLDYYGGFEYVPSECITEIGPYKVYAEEGNGEYCERIASALDHFEEQLEEEAA